MARSLPLDMTPMGESDVGAHCRLQNQMKKAGRDARFRINDLWLAAQAVQRDFKLLTSNPRDFEDIPGLKLASISIG